MSAIPARTLRSPLRANKDVTALIPDFPFEYGKFLSQSGKRSLCKIPASSYGKQVLVVGAGVAGMVSAYELMRMGLHPVVLEASDRIGGRLYSKKLGSPDNGVICELGGMRFPVSAKALFHYFEKVGLKSNLGDFPNPGTAPAVSTVVDYNGEPPVYYETTGTNFPKPPEYSQIETEFFTNFLGGDPFHFDEMENAMTEGFIDLQKIKAIWNKIIDNNGVTWDDKSFLRALQEKSGWDQEKINLFGQIGFGTGGWNTDFPNSILELLRVIYGGLDADHRLAYDGASTLPERLWSMSASTLGDEAAHWSGAATVETLTRQVIRDPFCKEIRQICPKPGGGFVVKFIDTRTQESFCREFDCVIYTPHVRVLDKLRYADGPASLAQMNPLLPQETWEAVMNTHYMQSTKVFASTSSPFWEERDPTDGKRKMSVTLSDRLTRGTYLVDYSPSLGPYRGSGMFLSYTWNDDALKFQGNLPPSEELCTHLLESIYPKINISDFYSQSDTFAKISWESEPHYLGAFKMNLPGHYEYQRLIFSQFMAGIEDNDPYGFILAGDDVSWTGGWAEGAVTTAINAVNKSAVYFGGSTQTNNPGPIDVWDDLKPLKRS